MRRVMTTLALGGLLAGTALAVTGSDALAKSRPEAGRSAFKMGQSVQHGRASWYGPGFHGRRTASGERFNLRAMTAAHRTLPFGTRVRVRHVSTGRSVVVRINDRGPFAHGRIIDLSRASAQALGISGTSAVTLVKL